MTRVLAFLGLLMGTFSIQAQSIISGPVFVVPELVYIPPASITSNCVPAPTVRYYVPAPVSSPPLRIERYYFDGTPAPLHSGSMSDLGQTVRMSRKVILREYYYKVASQKGTIAESESRVPRVSQDDRLPGLPPPKEVLETGNDSGAAEASEVLLPKQEEQPPSSSSGPDADEGPSSTKSDRTKAPANITAKP